MLVLVFKKGLAILNMLVFVFLFTIIAGVILALVSSHLRFIENHIRRTKAFYVAEAGIVVALESMRHGAAIFPPQLEWTYDTSGTPIVMKSPVITWVFNVGPDQTTEVKSMCDYSILW